MSYVNFLGSIGDVNNGEHCIEMLKKLCGIEEVDLGYVNTYHENVSGSKRYFTADVKELKMADEESNERLANYLWVDTGYKSVGGSIVYASFYKSNICWSGVYLGTEARLVHKLSSYLHKRVAAYIADESEDETKQDPYVDTESTNFGSYFNEGDIDGDEKKIQEAKALNNNKFCIKLYKRLLIKESWATCKERSNRLAKYIDALASKVQIDMKAGDNKNYIINGDGRAIVINSGLLDGFMNDIYILFDIAVDGTFVSPKLVENKTELMNIGFTRSDVKNMPEPIKFYKSRADLVFEGDIDDFNLDNRSKLHHIINERRFRFPLELQGLTENSLCDKLKQSIENAVRISKRDYKYIIPMYNSQSDVIQFLVPLYINNSLSDGPELVVVAGLINGFYEVMTILEPDDAYDNARLLSRPDNTWLKIKEAVKC